MSFVSHNLHTAVPILVQGVMYLPAAAATGPAIALDVCCTVSCLSMVKGAACSMPVSIITSSMLPTNNSFCPMLLPDNYL